MRTLFFSQNKTTTESPETIECKKGIYNFIPYLFFYFSFLYLELLLRFFTVKSFFNLSIVFICLILFIPAFLFGFLSDRKHNITKNIILYFLSILLIIYYGAQLVIYHIFGFYLSISALSLAKQATSYYKEAFTGITESWLPLVLTFLPIFLYTLLIFRTKKTSLNLPLSNKKKTKRILTLFISSLVTYILFIFFIFQGEKDTFSPYDLYFNTNNYDVSVPVFGAIGSTQLDIYRSIFGFHPKDSYLLSIPKDTMYSESKTEDNEMEVDNTQSIVTPTPTQEPIKVYEDNVMDIDFESLNLTQDEEDIKQLNSYFSSLSPSKKNEKTGIYEGYNVIYMTCEAFSPYAIDENLTPTLYKMAHDSYIFENFYTTGDWYTSTSDGEYMMSTGLIPMSVKNTFAKTYTNYFAFALPQILKPDGYSARAFHNNSGTVYSRNLTHPNLGYEFFSKDNGLEVSGWPESDLEMMEQSVPMYISDEKFLAYYMTVSGHLNYNFSGNTQAKKHEEEVAQLPYSEACKAYIACHIELDLAMEYLLNQLESAGVADHTLIVMVADHYPYGLSDAEISEFLGHDVETTFERYKSTLILYTPEKTDSEIITKPCEAIDVLPTILNMLGADYDSRMITGRDIFAEEPGLVIFPSRSFITEDYTFKFSGKEIISLNDREISEDEVLAMRKHIDDCFYVSSKIAELDYYRKIGLENYNFEK